MKKTFLALALVFASSSLAQAQMVAVDKTRIRDYGHALSRAINYTRLNCTVQGTHVASGRISEYTGSAEEFWIDTSGTQPSIIASSKLDQTRRYLFRFVTSADYMTINSLTVDVQFMEKVNKSTLIAPVIVDEYVTRETTTCTRI